MTRRARALVAGVPVASEEDEQVALFEWAARIRVPVGGIVVPLTDHMYAVPNGEVLHSGFSARQIGARVQRLLRMGWSPGALDVNVDIPRAQFHGLRLELKSRRRQAVVSADQHEWIARHARAGYLATVAFGCDDAIAVVRDYLGGQVVRP